jgi:hypothetical protein
VCENCGKTKDEHIQFNSSSKLWCYFDNKSASQFTPATPKVEAPLIQTGDEFSKVGRSCESCNELEKSIIERLALLKRQYGEFENPSLKQTVSDSIAQLQWVLQIMSKQNDMWICWNCGSHHNKKEKVCNKCRTNNTNPCVHCQQTSCVGCEFFKEQPQQGEQGKDTPTEIQSMMSLIKHLDKRLTALELQQIKDNAFINKIADDIAAMDWKKLESQQGEVRGTPENPLEFVVNIDGVVGLEKRLTSIENKIKIIEIQQKSRDAVKVLMPLLDKLGELLAVIEGSVYMMEKVESVRIDISNGIDKLDAELAKIKEGKK